MLHLFMRLWYRVEDRRYQMSELYDTTDLVLFILYQRVVQEDTPHLDRYWATRTFRTVHIMSNPMNEIMFDQALTTLGGNGSVAPAPRLFTRLAMAQEL